VKELLVDVQTIEQEYGQLQQESQELTQEIQSFATKLQTAGAAGDGQAKEWILDLKSIALAIQQEQLQIQGLLQALHDYVVNPPQPVPQAQSVVPMQAAEQPVQHGGFFSHFGGGGGGGGLGQAVVQGVGMGAGFGLADAAIGSIFC
jgi:hypothetical protein